MTSPTTAEQYIAMNRFGLGASPRDLGRLGRDPVKSVEAISQVRVPETLSGLPGSANMLRDTYALQNIPKTERKSVRRQLNAVRQRTERAHLLHAVTTQDTLVERLVLFWANHFTVSRTRGVIGHAIPAYITEAIRPHVLGSFGDMLLAVMRHPVMLTYLDNISSVGPNSRQGRRRDRDLNENLAREALELHTLGVEGGYSQDDVISLAKMLTGWGVNRNGRKDLGIDDIGRADTAGIGTFAFRGAAHEPGAKTLLGKTYSDSGEQQAAEAFRDLAVHPSTARHIARKFCSHFLGSTPDSAVGSLESRFLETNGDLLALTRALIRHPLAWRAPGASIKPPYSYLVAAIRVAEDPGKATALPAKLFGGALQSMGQPLHRAPSPEGWSDAGGDWVTAATLSRRLEWAQAVAGRMEVGPEPDDLYDIVAGPLAEPDARKLIASAPSREQGVALAIASPAFQRR